MTVSDIMTKGPKVCTKETGVCEVAQMMSELNCGAIPVVKSESDRQPLGMITDRDIVKRSTAMGLNPLDLKVEDCMTNKCFTIPVYETLSEAMKIMESMQVRRLMVVSDLGECIGMISQADISLHGTDGKIAGLLRRISVPQVDMAHGRAYAPH
jgi:CBS domain-containing protein